MPMDANLWLSTGSLSVREKLPKGSAPKSPEPPQKLPKFLHALFHPAQAEFSGEATQDWGKKTVKKPHFSQRRGAEIPHPGREGLTWRVLLEEGGKEKPLQVWSSPEERLLYPCGRADDSRLNSVTRIFHNQNRLRSHLLELSQRLGQIPPLPGAGDWVFFHGRHTQGCSSRDDLLIICLIPVLGRDPTKNRELGRLASAPE